MEVYPMEKQSFSVSTIDSNLKNSIIAKYVPQFDKMISSVLKNSANGEDNFSIPNIDTLALDEEMTPELGKELVNEYNSHFNPVYSNMIPVNIKIEQAAMMDSLMFGYELSTGKINLYTLNVGLLFGLGVDNDKMVERCFERNQIGVIHAYRIDMEYVSEKEFFFKAVSPQKKTLLYADDYVFFPYLYIDRGMKLLHMFMDKGFVLKVSQDLGDLVKTRYITDSKTVLKKYCDNEQAIEGVKGSYFPLKGYMYAPVVGAPSTTAMVTKIDLFSIMRIDPVRSYADIKVNKVSDPIRNAIVTDSIMKRMIELEQEDGWDYVDIMNNLPNGDKVFKDQQGRGVVNIVLLSKYLHTLDEDTLEGLVNEVPGCLDVVNKFSKIFNRYEFVDFSQMSRTEVRKALNEGIYKIVWMRSNCSYSTSTVTNNRKILEEIYGKGYFPKYEALNVRLNMLRYRVSMGYNIEESLVYCGFPVDADLIKAAEEFKNDSSGMSMEDPEYSVASKKFKEDVVELTGAQGKAEAATGSILARTCFATVKPDGSVDDYYRYISLPKVVRAIRIG